MSFTSADRVNEETNTLFANSLQVENLAEEGGMCRWRICTYVNGVLQGCTSKLTAIKSGNFRIDIYFLFALFVLFAVSFA